MTRTIATLALTLLLSGCAQKQQKPVPYLPEDGEESTQPSNGSTSTEGTPEETSPEGEIDLGIDGDYKPVAVEEGAPEEEADAPIKSCEAVEDCLGDPVLDKMGTWACESEQCIYTPKVKFKSN